MPSKIMKVKWENIAPLHKQSDARKLAQQAANDAKTYGDLLSVLSFAQLNELMLENQNTDTPIEDDDRGIRIREIAANVTVSRWAMCRRFNICREAAQHAIQEIINNDSNIAFTKDNATYGLLQFLGKVEY